MTNLNLHDIPGGELCRLCGLTFYARSMGGPGVCPSCDCGFSGPVVVERQAKEIERLRALLAQWEGNCTGRHGSQSPCGFTADHVVPADRAAVEPEVPPCRRQPCPTWDKCAALGGCAWLSENESSLRHTHDPDHMMFHPGCPACEAEKNSHG